MKQITQVNNSKGVIGLLLGLKSRITSTKPVLALLLLLMVGGWNSQVWGESYTVSLANTDTKDYTKNGEIKLTFSNVNKNSNGFALSKNLLLTGASSKDNNAREGQVVWENKKTGYSVKVTKAVAHFKTDVTGGIWGSTAYGIYGRIYSGNSSAGTQKMCKNSGYSEDDATINNSDGFANTIYFRSGHNSLGGETYLNKLTLYYSFTAETYTITLNKHNNENNATISVTYDSNKNLTSNVAVPTKTGYTFEGYYTGENGTGTKRVDKNGAWVAGSGFIESGKWKNAGDVTLHAKWTANKYEVTLNPNGGSPANNQTVTATYDAAMPTGAISARTKTGYSFAGYFDATSGGTKYYNANLSSARTWNKANAATLYAQWTANTYTVKFDAHGGSAVANKTVTYDATYGELATPTRAGYTFVGWFTDATGGTQVTATTKVQITATQTLHAHWTVNNYTITLNNQSATSAGTESIAVTYDANTNLTSAITVPTKTENTFEGYYTGTNGSGIKLIDKEGNVLASVSGYTNASRNWVYADNVTLYAYWKGNQKIVWDLLDGLNPRGKYYEYAAGEAFEAKSYAKADDALTGLTITYTSSDESIAVIENGNKLKVIKANEVVTITASQAGNNNWNAAESKSKTFKTCGAKPDNWNVSATNLEYGQLLEESTLSGVVKLGEVTVPGTLEWVAPTTLPNAGNHNYSVLFTPENEDAYGSVTFEVPVTVDKADPVIIWNIGARLRENTRYSNFVVSTNTEAALNISVSNSTLLSIEGNVLTTGAVTGTTNGWIKVSQPASANYNAVPEQTFSVTINPKSNVCLPFTLNETIYNNAKENSEGKVYWCTTNENGNRDNYILSYDVSYTQRVGIALGSWEDGLSGISAKKILNLIRGEGSFSWTTKYVDLSFTGVPDKISFDVESQKVTSTWPEVTWKASATDWYLYESADGVNYTQVGDKFVSGHQVRNRQLKEETRYVRIQYSGNFTGFVKNLQITQKKYLNVDKPTLTFGTEANPLQEPQTIKLSYASLGYCGDQNSKITVTSNNPAFYVDESEITENVDIDQMGEYTIRVRCNDVNQTGTLTIEANDGTKATVNVHSTKPDLTTAHKETLIFQTGTEHAVSEGSAYRTQQTHNFTACFNGGNPIFDTLYIYGVSESAAAERLWETDALKGYKVPALNVGEGNVHTPCFVYAKKGVQYEYVRTFDASTESLDIDAAGKKLGFIGYKPINGAVDAPAIRLSGGTEIYLNNAEIASKGESMVLNGTNTIHARGNNTCSSSNAAAIQLGSIASELTIADSWANDATPGKLVLKPAAGKPSIDLNGANSVTINGAQLELHNAVKMAIAHMDGETEKTDGSVKINDGTIVGESSLGMPQNTLIDGGTFNAGSIVCYNAKGKTVRPFNSRGEVLARAEKEYGDLPAWYGKSHLVQVAGRVYPMLFGGEGLSIFENTKSDHDAQNVLNWTESPSATSDAVIVADMEVNADLSVNSLTINEGVTVTVKDGATLTIGDGDSFREQAGNLHIENGGKVVLTTGELIVNDFILDAALGITDENVTTPSASGEVQNEAMLSVAGDAYFQLALDPSDRISYGWYDFTVPFAVDVIGGISIAENTSNVPLEFNKNYAVMDYTEAKRAVNGKDWNKFSGTMVPGRVYTIALDDDYEWNTVIFKKKAGAAITGDRSFTTEYSGLGANNKDNGWNGFGNGTLHHTELDVDDDAVIQLYDHKHKCYQARPAKDYTIAVGLSFFMQFDKVETINLLSAEDNGDKFMAPKREVRTVDHFRLALTAEDAVNAADYMWVSASEEATAEYTIGSDVLKMGTLNEATVARMWTKRAGMNLCKSEMQLVSNEANCELGLFAPQARTYTIAIEEAPEDANLYLTYNGEVIWDLTASPYVLDLAKGMTDGYGLRIAARAPQIATGVDETNADSKSVRKVLINNTIYLITPEGKMYDIVGKSAKY